MPSKPASVPRQAIMMISQDHCVPALRPLGFLRSSPHFWRAPEGGLHQSINFQASHWGTAESGSITINLGVSSPTLSMALYGRIRKPGTALWPIQARIGRLMPEKRDVWWDIDRNTDIALLGAEISKVLLSCAIPFLECFGTARIFDDHLLSGYDASSIGIFPGPLALARATLAAQLGDKELAASLLRAELEDVRSNSFADIVRRLAKELAVNLELAAER